MSIEYDQIKDLICTVMAVFAIHQIDTNKQTESSLSLCNTTNNKLIVNFSLSSLLDFGWYNHM